MSKVFSNFFPKTLDNHDRVIFEVFRGDGMILRPVGYHISRNSIDINSMYGEADGRSLRQPTSCFSRSGKGEKLDMVTFSGL